MFDKWESSIDLLLDRIQSRGIYIGGHAHPYANFDVHAIDDFAKAYWQEWVEGDQLGRGKGGRKSPQLFSKAEV